MSNELHITIYVSTGAKNARYTLRSARTSGEFLIDNYIRNLADDEDLAEQKAIAYVEDYKARVAGNGMIITYGGVWEEAFKRKGKLSVRDTQALEEIEDGRMPFGKNKGKRFEDLEENTLLYWADQAAKGEHSICIQGIAAACCGIAQERGLFAKRDIVRAERAELDAKSNFVGEVKQRLIFTGEIVSSFFKDGTESYSPSFHITKIRTAEDNLLTVFSYLGDKGETVTFKATVKAHSEYNGVKSTIVNRPKIVEVENA